MYTPYALFTCADCYIVLYIFSRKALRGRLLVLYIPNSLQSQSRTRGDVKLYILFQLNAEIRRMINWRDDNTGSFAFNVARKLRKALKSASIN